MFTSKTKNKKEAEQQNLDDVLSILLSELLIRDNLLSFTVHFHSLTEFGLPSMWQSLIFKLGASNVASVKQMCDG